MRNTRRHGPLPLPRKRINPELYDAVRASGHPIYRLALTAGIVHTSKFSALVTATSVPDTEKNRSRLSRIASAVGFDPALVFLDGDR